MGSYMGTNAQRKPSVEVVFQVRLRDRERGGELLDSLRGLGTVDDAALVLRDELMEA